MGYKALRNTYAVDNSSGVEVRRVVVAGDVFPVGYEPVNNSDVEETDEKVVSGHVVSEDAADPIADLKGEDLDDAVEAAGIEGASSMKADEKRQALRDAGYTP